MEMHISERQNSPKNASTEERMYERWEAELTIVYISNEKYYRFVK